MYRRAVRANFALLAGIVLATAVMQAVIGIFILAAGLALMGVVLFVLHWRCKRQFKRFDDARNFD